MIPVYVCHPYTTHGDPDANHAAQIAICQEVLRSGYLPVSPILTFGKVLPHDAASYDKAMEACFWLLSKCEQLWVFGDFMQSKGCRLEIEYAHKHDIQVVMGFTRVAITPQAGLPASILPSG